MSLLARTISALCVLAGVAAADPTVTVAPAKVHPGDPVLVTVTGTTDAPRGKAGGAELQFFPARAGFQAVFAVPLNVNEDHILVEFTAGPKPLSIPIVVTAFPETKVTVEQEYADPPKADRVTIDADNAAIGASYAKAAGAPQFAHGFHRPPGTVTSTFGEWRTFNDGHRAQHLWTRPRRARGKSGRRDRRRHCRARSRHVPRRHRRRDRARRRHLVALLPPLEGVRCRGRQGHARQQDRPRRSHRPHDRTAPPPEHSRAGRHGRPASFIKLPIYVRMTARPDQG
jgi:hypothetical protein